MNLHISKSKNSESFYIAKSYVKANGSTTSMIVRKLGTLDQLIVEHGPTRDDVLAWEKNEVKIETEKYKKDNRLEKRLVSHNPVAYRHEMGSTQSLLLSLFLQSIYYQMHIDKICRKLKEERLLEGSRILA